MKTRESAVGNRLAVLIPTLAGGGVERVALALASGIAARGLAVDLVVFRAEGPFRDVVPPAVRVVELEPGPLWKGRLLALRADPWGLGALLRPVLLPRRPPGRLGFLPALADYLRRERPRALLAGTRSPNLQAVWARSLSGVPARVVLTEHNTLSQQIGGSRRWKHRFVAPLVRRTYLRADVIVGVSKGVADDLSRRAGIPRERITAVYNPVVTPEVAAQARAPVDHPWFEPGLPPVILGVGRLTDQKDFPTLLRAFARVRASREARLLVIGEGERRRELEALSRDLGVAGDVSLPGFAPNPYAYMARAALFALSSAWEGLPTVLIEALACGCPVVSTDCPSGPQEILDGGAYGPLVPVGDDEALARAMVATLDAPPPASRLIARAAEFSADRAVDRYLALLTGEGGC